MAILAALFLVFAMVPHAQFAPSLAPHGVAPVQTLRIGRIDQASRRLEIHGLRPGERFDVYVNGRALGGAIARTADVRMRLRSSLHAGADVTVSTLDGRIVARARTTVQNDYLQYHYDLGRTGWDAAETTLTTTNVNKTTFGHLFSLPVDGFVYAQPLFVAGLTIGQGTYNVAFVATENDSLYAFDTDSGAPLWQQNYTDPANGFVPIPAQATGAQNIIPTIGITSTPAIDPDTGTIYFVAAIQQAVSGGYVYHQYLHAVDWTTGLDRPGSPADLAATVYLNNNKPVTFSQLLQLNRASTLLANGSVYIGFGNHDDTPTPGYRPHGWLFQYDAATLTMLGVLNTTLDAANKYNASIWGGGWGPDADPNSGNLVLATGDGPFDGDIGGNNWGDTVMELAPNMAHVDYFTPYDQAALQSTNHDLGAGGVLLLPDQPGAFVHLATVAGEEGTIYLLNRDSLGGYTPNGPDNVVQELPLAIHKLVGGPAYYGGPTGTYIYYCGAGDPLHAYLLSTSPSTQLALAGTAPNSCGGSGGAIPMVSSNGTTPGTGIVWITTRPANRATQQVQLRAYDATNVSHQLFATNVAYWQNLHNPPFLTPTVIGGRVFVGTSSSVEEYGLLSSLRHRRVP